MSPKRRSHLPPLVAVVALGLLLPAGSLGDTIDVSSTTMLLLREQRRAGGSVTVAPLYEILSVSAHEVQNPVARHLELVVSAWGAASLGRNWLWYDSEPPSHRLFADLDLAYVQGDLVSDALQLRLGRQLVNGGVTGSLQLDGAHVLVRLPQGVGVSAYLGSPVSQRMDARGTERTWNPQRGSFAWGGRAFFALPAWGELGASIVQVTDRGDPSRRQVGGDLRLSPLAWLTVLANTAYDTYSDRWAETNVTAQLQPLAALVARLEFRHVEPDLLLPRNSILSVFAVDRRNEIGGSLGYDLTRALSLGAEYRFLQQLDGGDGHRLGGRMGWHLDADTTLGVELSRLRTFQGSPWLRNGYFTVRGYGARRFGPVRATLDLQEYAFDENVNGENNSFLATGTLAYAFGRGFTALVSGSGGATPYYQSRFDVMAKLAYGASYHAQEVR